MATESTEYRAVSHLEFELVKSDYIIPHITKNDKTPSWDGQITLYDKKSHSVDSVIGQIPVQVKGNMVDELPDTCSESFKLADLQNYYKEKGCLYFVVKIQEETFRCRIFYQDLTLLELRNIIESLSVGKSQKTITLPLRVFPSGIEARESFLSAFHRAMMKNVIVRYLPNLPSLSECDRSQLVLDIPYSGDANKNILRILSSQSQYLYVKTSQGDVPVREGKLPIGFSGKSNTNVIVNGTIYYTDIFVQFKEGREIVTIGQSLEYEKLDDRVKFRLTLCDSFVQRLLDLEFLIAALQYGSFNVGKEEYVEMSGFPEESDILAYCEKQFHDLKMIQELWDELGVKEDLHMHQLTAKDEVELQKLCSCVLDHELYESPNEKTYFIVHTIANIKALILYEKVQQTDAGYTYRLHPVSEVRLELPLEGEIDKGVGITLITYIRHEKPELLAELSNLDWEHLVDEYERLSLEYCDVQVEQATFDMIEMLTQYDRTKKKILLDTASKIQQWLATKMKRKDEKQMATINRLQIALRQGELSKEDIEELVCIESTTRHHFVKYEASLLLGNMERANYWYSRLPEDRKKLLDTQPISLFKKF